MRHALFLVLLAGCTCRDLCRGPYHDAVEECDGRYDPSRDWAGIRACKAHAKQAYEVCIDDCRLPDLSGDGDDGTSF